MCGGEWLTKWIQISLSGWERVHFVGLRITGQLADGGVSIPPRSAIVVAEQTRMMQ